MHEAVVIVRYLTAEAAYSLCISRCLAPPLPPRDNSCHTLTLHVLGLDVWVRNRIRQTQWRRQTGSSKANLLW